MLPLVPSVTLRTGGKPSGLARYWIVQVGLPLANPWRAFYVVGLLLLLACQSSLFVCQNGETALRTSPDAAPRPFRQGWRPIRTKGRARSWIVKVGLPLLWRGSRLSEAGLPLT